MKEKFKLHHTDLYTLSHCDLLRHWRCHEYVLPIYFTLQTFPSSSVPELSVKYTPFLGKTVPYNHVSITSSIDLRS